MNWTFRQMRLEKVVARTKWQAVRAHKGLVDVFGAAGNEFGQLSNEKIVELSFVVRDHDHIDVMTSISMIGRIEREDLFIFKDYFKN